MLDNQKYYRQGNQIWMRAGDCAGQIGQFNNERIAQEFIEAVNKGAEKVDELKPDWSDRCISCRSLGSINNICAKPESPRFLELIDKPKQTTCKLWRYAF